MIVIIDQVIVIYQLNTNRHKAVLLVLLSSMIASTVYIKKSKMFVFSWYSDLICNYDDNIICSSQSLIDLYSSDLFVEYGMPSSHAQFMTFFATFFTLFIFIRYNAHIMWSSHDIHIIIGLSHHKKWKITCLKVCVLLGQCLDLYFVALAGNLCRWVAV